MEMTSYDDGVPSWVDFSSPDVDASVDFYTSLFGWTADEGAPETGGYRVCRIGDHQVAGIAPQMQPGMPPAWMTYVNMSDADAAAARIKDNGGQLFVEPMDVLDIGRMAVFADPVGAVLGIWQPGTHKGAGLVNEPGALCWNELLTTDVERSKTFYGAVFGWTATTSEGGPGGTYTEFKLADRPVAGMMPKPPMMPAEVPPAWGVYFAVDDCDAAVAQVEKLGGAQFVPPMDIEPGRFAVVSDPLGGVFNVIALRS
ncbi:MAG TPA: VOC family protein [Acidimicrobiales bacterium]|nr:VOC family protein [Acidimicrobiales bacterium]